jgi:hypothetical protein
VSIHNNTPDYQHIFQASREIKYSIETLYGVVEFRQPGGSEFYITFRFGDKVVAEACLERNEVHEVMQLIQEEWVNQKRRESDLLRKEYSAWILEADTKDLEAELDRRKNEGRW